MLVEALGPNYKINGNDLIKADAFLSGIKCEDSAFSLKINDVIFDRQTLELSVNISVAHV